MKNICLIGAGNIGSRHLQGLKKVTFPLSIEVIDPSAESLSIAQQRYEQIDSPIRHKISFSQDFRSISKNLDLAIIATSSNVRRKVTEELFKNSSVRYLILEKILFPKKEDYSAVDKLLKKMDCKAWVNFSMRTVPFYFNLQKEFKNSQLQFVVTGSKFGLVTNSIHFVDYIAFLTGCYDFEIDTKGLDPKPIESKRKGFLELNGTLNVYFKDGSFGSFSCYPDGNAPHLLHIESKDYRCISRENESKASISSSKSQWDWKEIDSHIIFQSQMTNLVAEKILQIGSCTLTPFTEAAKLHLPLFEGLLKFINSKGGKFTFYPFT